MTTATVHRFKTTDETRGDDLAAYAIDAGVYLDLDAGSSYWIEALVMARVYYDYGGKLQYYWGYDGALYDPGVHFVERNMPAYLTSAYEDRGGGERWFTSQAGLTTTTYLFTDNSPGQTYYRGFISLSGRITTTTAGRFGFWWKHWDLGAPYAAKATTVFGDSWIYSTPLDICPI